MLLFQNSLWQDTIAALITLTLAVLWLRMMDAIAHRGWLESKLSRKIIHIGTGPLFVLCWPLFSPEGHARYFAALVPLMITVQFVAIGVGWLKDPEAVQAMTRTGDPQEILRGPLYYGFVFVLCTIAFWRTSPIGIVALMLMCGGDGLADIIGRRWGKHKLPLNPNKSWAGSAAMFGGSFGLAFAMLAWFNTLGLFATPLNLGSTAGIVAAIALVGTVVEALPLQDVDNLTLTGAAVILGLWLF